MASSESKDSLVLLKRLLQFQGTRLNFKDLRNKNALETAVEHHNLEAVKLLLNR